MIHGKIGILEIYKMPKLTLLPALFEKNLPIFYCYLLCFQHNLPKNEIIKKFRLS
jgi:hypothetical protein